MTADELKNSDIRGPNPWYRRRVAAWAYLLILIVVTAVVSLAADWDATVTRVSFAQARENPTELRKFLQQMPKGADLHVHLSGAVYAERYIEWAAADDLSLLVCNMSIVKLPLAKPPKPPCEKTDEFIPMKKVAQDQTLRDRVINALSMRFFVPTAQVPSGHDQFFATFGRFGAVSGPHFNDIVLDQLVYYEAQAAQYVEFMASFSDFDERKPFVEAIVGKIDFKDKLAALDKAGLAAFVQGKKDELDRAVAAIEKQRACDAARTRPGCKVDYRFIAQISRNSPLDDVFVQTAIAAALARIEPLVVGFNYVQPEDADIALKDYSAHMRIVGFLRQSPPGAKPVNVSLHAGELWLGLVPPADLDFHIGEAVTIAGADRIGHGTALAFERDRDRLLAAMRAHKPLPVAVEINLTSNDMILGVRGHEHPFGTYRAAGVPVVLSTDDAGVERIDLTNEYVRATRDYRLGYAAVKELARASLVYSFLDDAGKKKKLESFDAQSATFERAIAARRTLLDNLILIVSAGFG